MSAQYRPPEYAHRGSKTRYSDDLIVLRKSGSEVIETIFKYWYEAVPDDQNRSMWVFSIYDKAIFVGIGRAEYGK